ncbi:MFS general substrate transporter [Teratosphaeria nubilosa]|uniref:MFS general substrate transporter n=1 Tax=Teratosphaeria nubilosa TaxID=161662 RepID=A0A6G1LL41_9PEZI|nr:MFS general substrate transporter [Teratosphaeria nubilosa]
MESAERGFPQQAEQDENDALEKQDTISAQDQNGHASNSLRKVPTLNKAVSLPREIFVVGLITLAQFTTQVGLGQTLSILHVIADSFGITEPGIESWLIAGYSLTVGTFILLSGRLGDVFGYKRMLIIGYAWFAIWEMVAGLSVYSNYVLFIWARVLMGIGPSIALPNSLALLAILYEPGRRKNMAFAVFGATAPAGSIIGSAFAAIFALRAAWWPWTFWSSAIVLAVASAMVAWFIPDPQVTPALPGSLRATFEMLDLPAAAVGITALVLINFAWNQAPIVGWHAAYVPVCLVLGVLLLPVFFYLEIKVSSEPLVPFSALNSTTAFVLGCVACGWANFGIWVFYLWQILEVLRGTSPLLASAYLTPLVVSGAAAAIVTGWLLAHVKPAWLMVVALSAFTASSLLIATVPPNQIYWAQIFVTTIVAPWGMDMSFPAATVYISNSIEKAKQGVAASLINTVVNYSISLGLGFAGTIETHVNNGGVTAADTLRGYRGALYMGIGLAGLGLALSLSFLVKQYYDERKTNAKSKDHRAVSPSEEESR